MTGAIPDTNGFSCTPKKPNPTEQDFFTVPLGGRKCLGSIFEQPGFLRAAGCAEKFVI